MKKCIFKGVGTAIITPFNEDGKVNYKELEKIRLLSTEKNEKQRIDAEKLITIRTKELKLIVASKYPKYSNEINNGYMALERYFEEISKYHS